MTITQKFYPKAMRCKLILLTNNILCLKLEIVRPLIKGIYHYVDYIHFQGGLGFPCVSLFGNAERQIRLLL